MIAEQKRSATQWAPSLDTIRNSNAAPESSPSRNTLRIFPECSGESLDLAFPRRTIKRSCGRCFLNVRLGLLFGKVRRLVLFFGANRGVRSNVQ